jgi:hypothetical protein
MQSCVTIWITVRTISFQMTKNKSENEGGGVGANKDTRCLTGVALHMVSVSLSNWQHPTCTSDDVEENIAGASHTNSCRQRHWSKDALSWRSDVLGGCDAQGKSFMSSHPMKPSKFDETGPSRLQLLLVNGSSQTFQSLQSRCLASSYIVIFKFQLIWVKSKNKC